MLILFLIPIFIGITIAAYKDYKEGEKLSVLHSIGFFIFSPIIVPIKIGTLIYQKLDK